MCVFVRVCVYENGEKLYQMSFWSATKFQWAQQLFQKLIISSHLRLLNPLQKPSPQVQFRLMESSFLSKRKRQWEHKSAAQVWADLHDRNFHEFVFLLIFLHYQAPSYKLLPQGFKKNILKYNKPLWLLLLLMATFRSSQTTTLQPDHMSATPSVISLFSMKYSAVNGTKERSWAMTQQLNTKESFPFHLLRNNGST